MYQRHFAGLVRYAGTGGSWGGDRWGYNPPHQIPAAAAASPANIEPSALTAATPGRPPSASATVWQAKELHPGSESRLPQCRRPAPGFPRCSSRRSPTGTARAAASFLRPGDWSSMDYATCWWRLAARCRILSARHGTESSRSRKSRAPMTATSAWPWAIRPSE